MARRLIFLAILVIGFTGLAWSQARDYSWEAYAQASSTNTNLIFGNPAGGVRLGTTWKPVPSFGLVADVGLQSGSGGSGSFSYTTFMGGPRIYSGERIRLSGFLQALGGAYRAATTLNSKKSTDWNYLCGGGAGFDMRLTDHIALRPLEYDLLIAGRDPSGVFVARLSAGLVFRFGR